MTMTPTIVYHVLTDELLEKLVTEKAQELIAAQRKKAEVPLNRKEVAKKFNRSVYYVDTHWRHLRHHTNGNPYWLESEVQAFINKK